MSLPFPEFPTLVELARYRAAEEPGRRMFVYLDNGVDESDALTLGRLDTRARAIAARLRRYASPGARALLSYPPGLDFVAAFFGCLYAGLVAVPAPPIGASRTDARYARVKAITERCRPELFLSDAAMLTRAEPLLGDTPLRRLTAVATDEVAEAEAVGWNPPPIGADTVAYLQFTSGTTGPPRGVVLTHGNVLHNLELIVRNGAHEEEDFDNVPPIVSWLPVFHDMGLIGGVVQPLYVRHDAVLMSPLAFVRHPYNWLRAIADRGEANSAAPGFGYDLCVRRVTDQQRRSLDLSGWRVALIGDEPVRARTIDEFSAAFGPCGFRRRAFFPSYGMAESTVMVSGGPVAAEPVIRRFDTAALAKGKVQLAGSDPAGRRLVGCGQVHPSLAAAVVDPVTGEPCAHDEVGEILISGPSIGTGYWNAPEDTERTFGATVRGHGGRRFLRTGSLGFRHEDQLFATCRVGDLIVVDGAQHYPYDIEATAAAAHPAVRDGFCCAFVVGERRRLVVLAEIDHRYRVLADPAGSTARRPVGVGEVVAAVRAAVLARHGVRVHDVVPLKMGALPLTTSGKLMRAECRSAYLARSLPSAVDTRPNP